MIMQRKAWPEIVAVVWKHKQLMRDADELIEDQGKAAVQEPGCSGSTELQGGRQQGARFSWPQQPQKIDNGQDIVSKSLAVCCCMGYLPEGTPSYGKITIRAFLKFAPRALGFAGRNEMTACCP